MDKVVFVTMEELLEIKLNILSSQVDKIITTLNTIIKKT